MATGAEILNYTGNANLGLGSNPSIPGLQREDTDMSDIHQAFRDVMMIDHENQMMLYQQGIKDRDTMRQMLENGQIPSGEIDAEYRPLYDAQEKKVEDAWHNVNGLNDTKNLEVFNREKRNLQDVVTQAQERTLMGKKLEVDRSKMTLPKDQEAMTAYIGKEKSKPFWERINEYVPPFSMTTEPLLKSANYDVTKTTATLENPFDTETQTFNYAGTKNSIDDLYYRGDKEAEDMRKLIDGVHQLPFEKRISALTAMNNRLAQAEKETGQVIPKINFDPATGLINELPNEFAAKYVAANQDQFKAESKTQNEKFTQLGISKGTLGETIRNNREKNAIEWAKLAIDKKKADAQIKLWDSKTTGSVQDKNAALDYATNLYGQLKQLADAKGVIDNNKLRQLTSEQLKYLGFYQQTTDKNGQTIKGLNPLSFDPDTEYIIRLDNGKIQVMKDAKLDKKAGQWRGYWDNSKTTTINNIATNRLNEENQLSAGKEINGYVNIDSGGENDGVETPDTTTETSLSTNTSDWKQEGNNWRYKDGTLYDAKGNVVKEKK